ncbi:hypothetical protein [Halocola ammonii]
MKRSIQVNFAAVLLMLFSVTLARAQSVNGNSAVIPIYQGGEDEFDPEERNGFSIGLTMGMYFANKKSAQFYNGACQNQLEDNIARCYDIATRLTPIQNGGTLSSNAYNDILDHYGASGGYLEFPRDMHPANMRYRPSFMYGLQVKYNFNYTSGLVFALNVTNLKTVDVYTVNIVGASPEQNEQNNIQVLDINGTEDRFHMTLGYRTGFETGPNANFFFEGGGTLLGTRVKSNEIFIAERSYELFIGIDNPNQAPQQYNPRTEVGIGFYGAMGWEMFFNDRYEVELGGRISRDPVKMGTYEEALFSSQIYLTFSI